MGARIKERDNGLDRMLRGMKQLAKDYRVTVGVQGSQAAASHGDVTNAELAAIHEFGAPAANVPQRSFLRSTADEGKTRWEKRLGEELAKVVLEGADARRALHVVGEEFRASVIDRIKQGIPPPLQPATVARKGEATPLIDTGALIGAITVAVRKGDET